MESIFDHAMATGRFAVVSSESVAAKVEEPMFLLRRPTLM